MTTTATPSKPPKPHLSKLPDGTWMVRYFMPSSGYRRGIRQSRETAFLFAKMVWET